MKRALCNVLFALVLVGLAHQATAQNNQSKNKPTTAGKVIAIDVLLEPDQTMISKAEAINARLRGDYKAGYELDATHSPHVTLLQRFV